MSATTQDDRVDAEARRNDLQQQYFARRAERDSLAFAVRQKKDEIAQISAQAREELAELRRQQDEAIAATKETWRQYRELDRALGKSGRRKKAVVEEDHEAVAEQVRRGIIRREDVPESIIDEVERLLQDRPEYDGPSGSFEAGD